jgi:hypothetical protein
MRGSADTRFWVRGSSFANPSTSMTDARPKDGKQKPQTSKAEV